MAPPELAGAIDRANAAVDSAPALDATPTRSRRARHELGLVLALWRRDLLRLRHDTGRWVGLVLQPVLLWVVLGSGMGKAFGPDYHRYFFPGLVAMISLFTAVFATMAVIEDRQRGFLQQVLVAPGSKAAMIAGKVLGVLSVAMLQLALVIPALPLSGFDLGAVAWPELLAVFVLGTTTIAACSFALAWVVRSTAGYHALMGVLLLPLWLVSGALFPLPAGSWLAALAWVNPMSFMVDGLRHALGAEAGMAHASAGTALVALLAWATAALVLASLVARRPVGGPE